MLSARKNIKSRMDSMIPSGIININALSLVTSINYKLASNNVLSQF